MTMRKETVAAIRASEAKWRRLAEGFYADGGASDCMLCQRFGNTCVITHENGETEKCPVLENSGAPCVNIEYRAWVALQQGYTLWKARDPITVSAARAEADYLHSLLPDEEREDEA